MTQPIPAGTLTGRTALVTGSSRGIGADTARYLAEGGANVVINFRNKAPRAEKLAARNAEREQASTAVVRPFQGLAAECDLVAMRAVGQAVDDGLGLLQVLASCGQMGRRLVARGARRGGRSTQQPSRAGTSPTRRK